MMRKKREFRHHYVPQFLIKNFSIEKGKRKNDDDYPIYIYDTIQDKSRIDIPRNILYKSFLNSIKIEQIRDFVEYYEKEGGDIDILKSMRMTAGYEDAWSRFDSYVSTLYKEIDKNDADVELRALISFFIAGSYIRNIKYINRFEFHNQFIKDQYYNYAAKFKSEYNFANEILNDDELKYLYYQSVFIDKESFQLFTDFFPVLLLSNSEFIMGDNPVVILNFYKDYINCIGVKENGIFSVTPINKEKAILLLPLYFIDMILDIKEVLERKKSCMDVTTGLTIDNENIIRIANQVISSILESSNKYDQFPLVRYQCNKRDVELLNFLQIVNSNRLVLSHIPPDDLVKDYFNKKPSLKKRNQHEKNRYLKTGEVSDYEIFEIGNSSDKGVENKDALFHIRENKVYYNDLDGFYRTIIFKIQKSTRVGFEMIKEKKYGKILHVKKRHITNA